MNKLLAEYIAFYLGYPPNEILKLIEQYERQIMGSKEGARKARLYIIEQYGSVERYKEKMRELGSIGGRSGSNGLKGLTHAQRVANGKKYGRKKIDIVK